MAGYYDGQTSAQDRSVRENPYNSGLRTAAPTSARRDIAGMTPQERFDYAKTYRVGFGQFKDMELTQIANVGINEDERGLLYLDWLHRQEWLNSACRGAIDAFVAWEPVAADIEKAVERDAIKRGSKVN